MDRHRMALALFTVAVALVIVIASAITMQSIKTHRANHDRPVGTVGLAKSHHAPGEPLPKGR
jgi:hypothetical protein